MALPKLPDCYSSFLVYLGPETWNSLPEHIKAKNTRSWKLHNNLVCRKMSLQYMQICGLISWLLFKKKNSLFVRNGFLCTQFFLCWSFCSLSWVVISKETIVKVEFFGSLENCWFYLLGRATNSSMKMDVCKCLYI